MGRYEDYHEVQAASQLLEDRCPTCEEAQLTSVHAVKELLTVDEVAQICAFAEQVTNTMCETV